MKFLYLSILCFVFTLGAAQSVVIADFASGLNKPVNIKNAGDSRLFVVEQDGFIRIVESNGNLLTTPFLNIDAVVSNSGGERGLLGLAFHPNYATNGYFYVNYVNNSGNTVISRYTRNATDPNLADSSTALQILTYNQPYGNHNGGDMAFGVDGFLYISSGDGGSSGDPGNRAQSLTTLLGKLLRLDVDNPSNGNNYGIPADNPFVGNASVMQEIWAYGLRNPWKFSFDRNTNELWIADVGQNNIEEIDFVPSTQAGINFGWRCYEGNSPYDTSANCPDPSTLTFPVAQYTHTTSGAFKCSITGGYRYHGTDQPGFEGLYFFADYCSDEIGILEENGSSWNMTFTQSFPGNGFTTFGEDINGELYIAGLQSGMIYKLVEENLGIQDKSSVEVRLFPNPVSHELSIELLNSSIVIRSVKIYNMEGRMIYKNDNQSKNSMIINMEDFTSGVYFVAVTSSEGFKTISKIIKH